MKCLSLMEPYATLTALGEKKIETRSWKTNYRGKIGIHASKGINKSCKMICLENQFFNILKGKYIIIDSNNKVQYNFSFGKIIATCELIDCVQMKELYDDYAVLENGMIVRGNELVFGNYTPLRYAWILDNVTLLEKPIDAKGQLGLWNYDI